MPTISLRMTDGELEQLKAWAHDNRRSMQREAIYRLFAMHAVPQLRDGTGTYLKADAQPRDVPARTIVPDSTDAHFKPDFK